MPDHAHLGSIEALGDFRSAVLVFLKKSTGCVDEAGSEIRRTRAWIQHDARLHWEGEVRRRRNALDRAEQELLSARLSALRENLSGQQMAVRKAKHALDEAETKLRNVKKWARDFETAIDPLFKRLESLRERLHDELPQAAAFLAKAQTTLEQYAERPPPAPASNAETTQTPE